MSNMNRLHNSIAQVVSVILLLGILLPGNTLADRPALTESEKAEQREAFVKYLRQHFLDPKKNPLLGQLSMTDTATVFGYALSRELQRVRSGSKRHQIWRYLHDHSERTVVAGLAGASQPNASAEWKAEQTRAIKTAFQRAIAGLNEQHSAALTGVPPTGEPMFFVGKEAKPRKNTRITLDDLRATERGQQLKRLNAELRTLRAAINEYSEGSKKYNFMRDEYRAVRRQRNRLAKPFKGIRGQKIRLHGHPAIARVDEIKREIIRYMQGSPDYRPGMLHAWITNRNKIEFARNQPPAYQVLMD